MNFHEFETVKGNRALINFDNVVSMRKYEISSPCLKIWFVGGETIRIRATLDEVKALFEPPILVSNPADYAESIKNSGPGKVELMQQQYNYLMSHIAENIDVPHEIEEDKDLLLSKDVITG